jgi:hypothetical protein
MLKQPRRFILLAITSGCAILAGINWKAVWLDSPRHPVHLKVGETQQYRIVGLNGMETTADLTRSPYLTITSSDPKILEIDRRNAAFVASNPGRVEIRISFSEATSIVQGIVVEGNAKTH